MKNLVLTAKADSLSTLAAFYWTIQGLEDEIYDKVMKDVFIEGYTLTIPAV